MYLNSPHAAPGSEELKYSIDAVREKGNKEHMAFYKKLKKAIVEIRDAEFGDPNVKKYKFQSRPCGHGGRL